MNKIKEYIFKSFTTESGGFAARKLSAFAAICVAVVMTFIYCEPKYFIEALIIWLVFALLCLGLVTMTQVIALKNGKSENPSPEDQKQNI